MTPTALILMFCAGALFTLGYERADSLLLLAAACALTGGVLLAGMQEEA